jgi:hypothetical protein
VRLYLEISKLNHLSRVFEKEPVWALFLCPGMDGMQQGAKDGVLLCPGMDGISQDTTNVA